MVAGGGGESAGVAVCVFGCDCYVDLSRGFSVLSEDGDGDRGPGITNFYYVVRTGKNGGN